ncbi:PAS domain-containing sensor histidine kinase [Desulfonema ishimotonii]|uniref:histidine kinase n=1 Tax=Desulfonema ishimotonii TaxID=45657 RepID=A0A401FWY3_9BACT|nr:ATP-binding protein [Desulfonema ishimotonii]GBC61480.1 PAS domain-containing sensor histidine kinase [Desulfonema ishimotonii]
MKTPIPLFWKIYPASLLVLVITLLSLTTYSFFGVKRFFTAHTAEDLTSRAFLMEYQIRKYLTPPDRAEIDAICKAGGKDSGTRITVILPSGEVIGDSEEPPERMDNHSQRPEIAKALFGETGVSTRYSDTLAQNMMYVAIPVEEKSGKTLGVIRTAMPADSIRHTLRSIQNRNILAALLIALIAAGISMYLSRRISRPIEAMRKGVEKFARGDLTHRLPTPESKEMVLLANAMNHMAQELDQRIQTVRRQRNELEAVLSSMQEGVIALDRDEKVININSAAAQMFHCSSEAPVGRAIQEIVRNPELHRFVKRALADEAPRERDITFYHDAEYVLNTHSSTLRGADGKSMGTLIVFYDVTRLRRLENMRREFAANVSHEIRTPLTAIKGFVETLRNGAMEKPEEAARFLEIIDNHANRLTLIITDLIKLSEIEQRKQLSTEVRKVGPVIRSAVEICQVAADKNNIPIEVVCDDDPEANINAPFIEQALVNLVDNAIKYSRAGKSVSVSASQTDTEVILRVRDQGIGIPRAHLPRLFERFYRVDKSRSRKQGGTGLGLAIVKHIVQAHGGYVNVESVLNQGSVFEIRLPRKPA